jgi:hypothetical protein
MIRDYVLHKRSNKEVQVKLSLVDRKDGLCRRTMDRWASRFRSGRTSVENDERAGRPSSDCLSSAVSSDLNRNTHGSCREIVKDFFILMTIIVRVWDEMGLRFFFARWMPYKLWPELKAKRIEICQEMLDILEQLGPRQKTCYYRGWMLYLLG